MLALSNPAYEESLCASARESFSGPKFTGAASARRACSVQCRAAFLGRGRPVLPGCRPGRYYPHSVQQGWLPHLDKRRDQRDVYCPNRSIAARPKQLGGLHSSARYEPGYNPPGL